MELQTDKIKIVILGGTGKDGKPESVERIEIERGEVVALAGPTGSGKSRFLADIEWMSNGDSPTGRRVLIEGMGELSRNESQSLVARLSQSMTYHLDLTVAEFLRSLAANRPEDEAAVLTRETIECANSLSGEPFSADAALCSLSGGQARALMIAETVELSGAPVILIDEVENAGINRVQAAILLMRAGKIAVMATHDPLLALMANRRIVFSNGAMSADLTTTSSEKETLVRLQEVEVRLECARLAMRDGRRISPGTVF